MPDIFLYTGEPNRSDIKLRDPTTIAGGGATITADLAAVEAADIAAFSAVLVRVATLAVTEASDSAAFNAVRLSVGTLASTEGADVAAFSAALVHTGALAALEAKDVAAFSGTLIHVADLAATEAPDVLAFAASITQTITADMAAAEAPDLASFDATLVHGQEEVQARGKGDNERGRKRLSLPQRGIVKPTGLTYKTRKSDKKAPAEQELDEALARAADQYAASAFVEQLKDAPLARIPVAQMSLEQIEREIGALLHKQMRTDDEDLMLVILLAAAATV